MNHEEEHNRRNILGVFQWAPNLRLHGLLEYNKLSKQLLGQKYWTKLSLFSENQQNAFQGSEKSQFLALPLFGKNRGFLSGLFLNYCLNIFQRLPPQVMRTPRNIFLINLAISDLLLCLFTIPATLADSLTHFWRVGEDMVSISTLLCNITLLYSWENN